MVKAPHHSNQRNNICGNKINLDNQTTTTTQQDPLWVEAESAGLEVEEEEEVRGHLQWREARGQRPGRRGGR